MNTYICMQNVCNTMNIIFLESIFNCRYVGQLDQCRSIACFPFIVWYQVTDLMSHVICVVFYNFTLQQKKKEDCKVKHCFWNVELVNNFLPKLNRWAITNCGVFLPPVLEILAFKMSRGDCKFLTKLAL